ncbi:ATP-dependent helicase [Bacillus thuringiensis]|uniref:DNA 3'-5' helicase n=3 Tax=Bacillus thuringiensis TaxID=1428 RepID=A0AB35PC95_BACTU|nr:MULTISPECIES: ATP-dependent helicase [Bacillus]EAO57205.1 ATP-dependent DNA helicase pcrA [Bacillus thuringiensis serovar israelensis ATCC 35646]MEC3434220.1 ATP-dependent helicase [Bacillus cereus]AFQ30363.1 ATP-dependent DNA helicase PcrA [Bacillus thuringiensis HD-789]AJH02415.1 ATP-dependent DNA helicase PcrA [Bacillus thuringiensis HD1002]AND28552.1 ATP-dependent DNA helicase PcrA [Bacillus thuringiensis serovar israelensis]
MLATVENPLMGTLNSSQQRAVLTTEGRVLVLAGAGSGKTKVLTTRIAYLLQQGVDPWRILAITFTNKSAKEMKERVTGMDSRASKSWIGTFHSICNRILSTNIHHLGMDMFTLMDDTDQKALVKTAAVQLGLEADKNIVYNLLSQISLWKNEAISPGQAQSNSTGDKEKLAVSHIYQKYEDLKAIHNYFDYDDLLLKTVHLFQNNPELLGRYQNLFRYVLVDEFQDTNKIQFDLIEMLSQKHGNIFLVGDADQSIYSFRSAKIENILSYQKIHPETQLILLQENYRSTQNIVNASNSLVGNNKMRLEREAFSVSGVGDDIHVFRFNDASREADFVARMIVNMKKATQCDWKDFAVLYRMNFQSKHLELALRDENIPYKIVGTTSFYDRKEIKDLVSYIRASHNLTDDYALERVINVPSRKIGKTTIEKIYAFAHERRIPFFVALQNIDEVAALSKINKSTVAKIKEFATLMQELSQLALVGEFSATKFMQTLIKKTDFMGQFDKEKEEDETRIENVTHLRDYARHWDAQEKEINSLAQFVSEITLDGDSDEDEEDFVTLTSVHSAKGLEWPETFVIGLEDDVFPHYRSKQKLSDLEEERRLMYVAMTRAGKRLYLTHSAFKYEYGSQKPIRQKPSPFLGEIPDNYKTVMIQTA